VSAPVPSIYIAGPMTGLPEFNFPAFHEAAKAWRAAGWNVLNPAEHFGGRTDLPKRRYLAKAFRTVCEADAIALLPGWGNSPGALAERAMALALGLPCHRAGNVTPPPNSEIRPENSGLGGCPPHGPSGFWADFRSTNSPVQGEHGETVLDEAKALIYGDRNEAYGHPADDYARTAGLWSALLGSKLREPISPGEAILCMICVKLSREAHRPKRDNRVDLAGYAGCLQRVADREAGRE